MNIVTSKNAVAHTVHHFVTEASNLGLKPGEWPASLETDLGNKQPFRIYGVSEGGTHIYQQELGCLRLTVFND